MGEKYKDGVADGQEPHGQTEEYVGNHKDGFPNGQEQTA